MTKMETEAFIANRKNRVDESLEATSLLAENKLYSAAVSRLYYAIFYAASALLAKHEIRPKSHTGTIHLFSLHFVKTGKIDTVLATNFQTAFKLRQLGDYGEIPPLVKEDFHKIDAPAKELIEKILSLL